MDPGVSDEVEDTFDPTLLVLGLSVLMVLALGIGLFGASRYLNGRFGHSGRKG
jgi:hypothetical protein